MMTSDEKNHGSIYYVIPAQIFEDLDLEDSEKIFYGLLSGLAFSNGFCFASDAYLAKRKNVDERTIKRWLEKLEKKGYIRRDTKKNGMYWDRKIFITHSHVNSNKSYERTPKPSSKGHVCPVDRGTHVPIVSEVPPASEILPPLPPPSSKDKPLPITPEEEEEIQKLLRERPEGMPKIKSMRSWRKVVLEDIRSSGMMIRANADQTRANRAEAFLADMRKNSHGELTCAYEDHVEFSCGNKVRKVLYNTPYEEWIKQTGW
jgi:hypothetical protein